MIGPNDLHIPAHRYSVAVIKSVTMYEDRMSQTSSIVFSYIYSTTTCFDL